MRILILSIFLFGAAMCAIMYRFIPTVRFVRTPETADIPEPDVAFRKAYDANAATPDWNEILATHRLMEASLVAGRFADLDSILGSAQEEFESNPAAEVRLYFLYSLFGLEIPGLEDRIDRWVDAGGARYPALTARALRRYELAWEARGHGWIQEATKDGLKKMEGLLEASEADAKSAIALRPKSSIPRILLIKIAMTGSSGNIRGYAEDAFRANPASYQAHYAYLSALLPRWGGSYRAMEGFLRKVRRMEDLNPELASLRGMTDWDRATRYLRSDSAAAATNALKALDKGEAKSPWWKLDYERGRALNKLGRREEALNAFEAAAAKRPGESSCHLQCAKLLLDLDRWDAAEEAYALAVAANPHDPDLSGYGEKKSEKLMMRAWEDSKRGDRAEALREYALAIAADPSNAQAYKFRGSVKAESGDLDGALADMQAAIRLDPHYLEAYRTLDWILAHKQDWRTIAGYWDAFLALEPDNPQALFERSGTLYHLGDMASAKRDAQRACDLKLEEACKTVSAYF
jgi:tetratricopeptide (TPR) repeat protein